MSRNKRTKNNPDALQLSLIKKVLLYSDNIRRFEFKQLFYFLINRIIKPHLPFFILKHKENLHNYSVVKSNINLLFGFVKMWRITEDSLIHEDRYFQLFMKKVLEKKSYYQLNLDDFEETDLEIINNLYRFHLIAEISNELKITPPEKIAIIVEWIDNTSVSRDNKWNGFNTSMRLINWIKILHSLPDQFQPEQNDWEKIVNSIILHLKIICHNIENHVPGNHVLIQYFSLWLVYNIFSEWKNSEVYSSRNRNKLLKEIDKEFYKDGSHFEFSFHYHVQITLFNLIWLYGLSVLGQQISIEVKNKIVKASNLIEDFLFPDGTIPMIGDNCYTFINSSLKEDINLCNRLSNLILSERNDTKKFDDKLVITKSYVISKAGNSKIIFDIGNIGYKSNPGHGHSDLLSILYFDKEPLFIDPGTKTYDNREESILQKKVISHNTLSVDRDDQAFLWGFFRWSFLPSHLRQTVQNNKEMILAGEFHGFRNRGGFKHKREVSFTDSGIILKDSVLGKGIHDILINFILAPNITFTVEEDLIILSGRENSWHMKIHSIRKFNVSEHSINIFPAYNVSRFSRKLCVNFELVSFPFDSEIEVFRA
jgi:hypothetical protein